MEEKKLFLSDRSREILTKIENLLRPYPGLMAYLGDGIVEKNFKKYDLKSKTRRDDFEKECQLSLAYILVLMTKIEMDKSGKRHRNGTPAQQKIRTRKLDPWISLSFLIQDLDFQMETMDLIDPYQ